MSRSKFTSIIYHFRPLRASTHFQQIFDNHVGPVCFVHLMKKMMNSGAFLSELYLPIDRVRNRIFMSVEALHSDKLDSPKFENFLETNI